MSQYSNIEPKLEHALEPFQAEEVTLPKFDSHPVELISSSKQSIDRTERNLSIDRLIELFGGDFSDFR